MEPRLNDDSAGLRAKFAKHINAARRGRHPVRFAGPSARTGEDQGEPDQRVRRLYRHAHEGCRHAGETAVQLNLVVVWREATVFTEEERAALELTEQGTASRTPSAVSPTTPGGSTWPSTTTRPTRRVGLSHRPNQHLQPAERHHTAARRATIGPVSGASRYPVASGSLPSGPFDTGDRGSGTAWRVPAGSVLPGSFETAECSPGARTAGQRDRGFPPTASTPRRHRESGELAGPRRKVRVALVVDHPTGTIASLTSLVVGRIDQSHLT